MKRGDPNLWNYGRNRGVTFYIESATAWPLLSITPAKYSKVRLDFAGKCKCLYISALFIHSSDVLTRNFLRFKMCKYLFPDFKLRVIGVVCIKCSKYLLMLHRKVFTIKNYVLWYIQYLLLLWGTYCHPNLNRSTWY